MQKGQNKGYKGARPQWVMPLSRQPKRVRRVRVYQPPLFPEMKEPLQRRYWNRIQKEAKQSREWDKVHSALKRLHKLGDAYLHIYGEFLERKRLRGIVTKARSELEKSSRESAEAEMEAEGLWHDLVHRRNSPSKRLSLRVEKVLRKFESRSQENAEWLHAQRGKLIKSNRVGMGLNLYLLFLVRMKERRLKIPNWLPKRL